MKRLALATVVVSSIAALYLLRLDHAAGLYVDDAWYIVLAEALWTGRGFRLISSAGAAIVPPVPPMFPMILAPFVGLKPHFPDNVFVLKAISIVAMFALGFAVYGYTARRYGTPRAGAAMVAIATVMLPALVFLATSMVMPEIVFTLSQLLLAVMIERAVEKPSGRSTALAGVMGGVTFLIRSAGIASVAGAALYLAWRRGFRSALAFASIVVICYTPWVWYSIANASTPEERAAHGGPMSAQYGELLFRRRGAEASSGRVTLPGVFERISSNALEVFALDSGVFVIPGAYRSAAESGLEALQLSRETGFRASTMGGNVASWWVSSAVSLVMIVGFVTSLRRRATVAEFIAVMTVAMVLLVPARSIRYVLPLAPFLAFYFFQGVQAIARPRSPDFGAGFRVAAVCVITMFTIDHLQYIVAMRTGESPWLRDYAEVKAETDWMRLNLKREGPVATSNPGLVYLTTGRKSLALTNLPSNWLALQKLGVPFAATLHMTEPPAIGPEFPVIYQSPVLKLWVVEIPPAHHDKN